MVFNSDNIYQHLRLEQLRIAMNQIFVSKYIEGQRIRS